jgi:hypothetical protein
VEAEVWNVLHVDVFVALFHAFAKLLLSHVRAPVMRYTAGLFSSI